MTDWNPISTLETPPEKDQWVFYYFEPFEKWYTGTWDGICFTGRYGFCDKYDAPYWHPMQPSPMKESDE